MTGSPVVGTNASGSAQTTLVEAGKSTEQALIKPAKGAAYVVPPVMRAKVHAPSVLAVQHMRHSQEYALCSAAAVNDFHRMRTILAQGHGPNVRDITGLTPLQHAAINSAFDATCALWQHGDTVDPPSALDLAKSYVDAHDPDRKNPEMREFEEIFISLSKGPPPKQTISGSHVELFKAVNANDPDTVQKLLWDGTNPNVADPVTGQTAVQLTAKLGFLKVARVLVTDARSFDPGSAVSNAARIANQKDPEGTDAEVRAFYRYFEDIALRDGQGRPISAALRDAVDTDDDDVIKEFIAHGGDPNFADPLSGKTLVQQAAECFSGRVARLLAENENTVDKPGTGPRAVRIATIRARDRDPAGTDRNVQATLGHFKAIAARTSTFSEEEKALQKWEDDLPLRKEPVMTADQEAVATGTLQDGRTRDQDGSADTLVKALRLARLEKLHEEASRAVEGPARKARKRSHATDATQSRGASTSAEGSPLKSLSTDEAQALKTSIAKLIQWASATQKITQKVVLIAESYLMQLPATTLAMEPKLLLTACLSIAQAYDDPFGGRIRVDGWAKEAGIDNPRLLHETELQILETLQYRVDSEHVGIDKPNHLNDLSRWRW